METEKSGAFQHREILLPRRDAEAAVLFIHGFLGSPLQFEDLCQAVYQKGYAAYALLLPGHGGSSTQFARTRLDAWEAYTDAQVEKICRRYKRVYLVGHSIGGLLALEAAVTRQEQVAGVVAIAPPMRIKLSPRGAVNGLKSASQKDAAQNAIAMAYHRSNSVTPPSLPGYLTYLPRVMDIERLIAKSKKILPAITIPTLVIHSKNDEAVRFKSGAIIDRRLSQSHTRRVTLNDSWHAYYVASEREKIQREILRFIGAR